LLSFEGALPGEIQTQQMWRWVTEKASTCRDRLKREREEGAPVFDRDREELTTQRESTGVRATEKNRREREGLKREKMGE